eukprot:8183171-Ditylum_brightwellii.AAC.1
MITGTSSNAGNIDGPTTLYHLKFNPPPSGDRKMTETRKPEVLQRCSHNKRNLSSLLKQGKQLNAKANAN